MKKHFKSPLAIGLITTTFGAIVTAIIDYAKKLPVLTTIRTIFRAIWNAVLAFFNFELKVWWILIGFGVIILALVIIAKYQDKNAEGGYDFRDYTTDYFRGLKWRWKWEKLYGNTWGAVNLSALCPHCDTPMNDENGYSYTFFSCPRCKQTKEISEANLKHNLERVIHDNIDRKRHEFEQSKSKNNP